MSDDRYQLIDFGDGRKLENLAGHRIERPCPAASDVRPHDRDLWRDVDASYDAVSKSWTHHRPWPKDLKIDCGSFRMPLRPTPFGHIGVFPEQADNWKWLAACAPPSVASNSALNLFGYTGASTLALVTAGYNVAHVDAAKPNVQALRLAAEINGLSSAPIRYLVDDAAKFTAREVRRARRYHTILMDPPAYGHAPSGKAWRLERDLWPLLDDCLKLVDPTQFRLLVTGHSPQVDQSDVVQYLRESGFLPVAGLATGVLLESGRSILKDSIGRSLDAGFYARVAVQIIQSTG